jgi:hypothetical protein
MVEEAMKCILYLTDNSLDAKLHDKCIETLLKAAGNIGIVSVSQKPLDLGLNVCVGEIGRSWMSLYNQQVAGLEAIPSHATVYVAEHDVLYHADHFQHDITDRSKFWYNENVWLVEGTDRKGLYGCYSRWPRRRLALSQMVAAHDLYLNLMRDRLALIDGGLELAKKFGDPGSTPPEIVAAARRAVSGSCAYVGPILHRYIEWYKAETFRTKTANVDIRHGTNFTGPRRGSKRTYDVPYWGNFGEVMA